MKGIKYLIFLLTILIPSVAAATSSQYGDSGLISVPSAETTERGIYSAAAWFNNSQNNGNKAARFPISLAMGIGYGWEFFGSYPDISFANQDDGSMRNFGSVGIKFRLTGGPDSNLKTSATAFLRQTVSEDENLAGLRDIGSRLIMSYSLAKADIHLNAGYLKVASPDTEKYSNEVLFGGAVDISISNKMNTFLEVDGNTSREEGMPSRIEISPGMQYYMLPSIALTGGVGFGLTDAGPDYRVVVGLTFVSGAGKYAKAIPIIPGSRERYAAMSAGSIEELIPELPAGTTEGIAKELRTAPLPGGEPGAVPTMEALEAFQAPPAPAGQAPSLSAKEITAPGALIGSAEVEAISMEPPMPVILTTPVEKAAAMEGAPLAPEVPAAASTEVFMPPLPVSAPVSGENVEVFVAGKEKAEVHQEVVEEAGEGRKKTTRYYIIWYPFRSSELTPFAKGILDRIGEENKDEKQLVVEIAGHTDNIGSAAANRGLSYKRVESAKDYLVKKHGLDPNIFIVNGYGEEMPAAYNDTPDGRAKNRRVEIMAFSVEGGTEAAKTLVTPLAERYKAYRKTGPPVETPSSAFVPPPPASAAEGAAAKTLTPQEAEALAGISPVAFTPPVPATGQPKTGKRILYREVLFLAEKSEPSPVVKGILDKMAENIKKSGEHIVVMIDGYADGKEAASSLEELSYNRTNGIKEYLVQKHGFDPNVFVLKGHGKERALSSSDASRNRRAEIAVYSAVGGAETATISPPFPAPVKETPPVTMEPSMPVSEEKPAENIPPKPMEEKVIEAVPPMPEPVIPPVASPVTEALPLLPTSETTSKNDERVTTGKRIIYREILFLAEKSEPSPVVKGILDKMAENIKKSGKRFVARIEGHTDSQESTNPTELSYNRANNVKDYLVQKHGFGPNAFVLKGYGSERPVSRDATPEGMKRNRRVEITVYEAKD